MRTWIASLLILFITTVSAAAATRATAFGDSYTARSNSWYDILELGDDSFAVSGAVCNPAFTTRRAQRLETEISKWRAAGRPTNDWVIVFIGINDIIAATDTFGPSRSAYLDALQALKGAGAKLVLVTVPDLGKVPRYAGTSQAAGLTQRTKLWNSFIKKQATRYNASLVDLFNKLPTGNLYGPDGLHPNKRGMNVIAHAIDAKL